jgi:hypothetical protein
MIAPNSPQGPNSTPMVCLPDGTGVRVELVWLTPELADAWLKLYRQPHQRPTGKNHIEFLAYEMGAGRFAVTAIYLVHWDGKTSLNDGQHRCEAVVRSGKTILVPVVHLHVADEEDVKTDYIRRDIHRMRSIAQMYQATSLEDAVGLNGTQLNALGAACQVILSSFGKTAGTTLSPEQRSRDVRRAVILDWASDAQFFYNVITGHAGLMRNALTRAAVMSVALTTFRHVPDKAPLFWERVAKDEGLVSGDPERALVQYLLKHKAAARPRHEYARAVANAWNAYHDGRSLSLLKVAPEQCEKPILIAGTPYDGKRIINLSY